MFSVVIPVYNKAPYLKKAIQSVKDQTFSDWELILVDDGSTDFSVNVIHESIENSTNIFLISQPNQGVSTARNNGVRCAKYEYIAFLDADDWWDSDFLFHLNRLVKLFPDAGIYSCQYFWEKLNNRKLSKNYEGPSFEGYLDYFKAYTYAWWMPVTSINVVIPKKIFQESGGFNPILKFGEDFDLWVRILLKYRLAYLNKPLAYYFQDVPKENRALGQKLWGLKDHYIFNLDYLSEIEKNNLSLKKLLDGLRVRALLRYHLSGKYTNEVNIELGKVNFEQQTAYYRFIYNSPKSLVKLFFFLQKIGSLIKQYLKKSYYK